MNPENTVNQAQIWIEKGVELATSFGPRVIGAIVILIVGSWFAKKMARIASAGMRKAKLDETLSTFGGTAVRYLILVFVGLAVLNFFGVQTTSFVAILGAAGFAVGLALQGTLGNFSAGVMLLFFRPFNIGDVVEIAGTSGTVIALGIFSTRLRTPNGDLVIVPNGQVYGSVIRNFTPAELRRVDTDIGVEYGADADKAREVLIEALKTVPGAVMEPPVDAYLMGLGASSVDFQMRVWAKPEDFWPVRQASMLIGKKALEAAGIGIPYQTIDINIVSQPETR